MFLNFIIIPKRKFFTLTHVSHQAPRMSEKMKKVSCNYQKSKELLIFSRELKSANGL